MQLDLGMFLYITKDHQFFSMYFLGSFSYCQKTVQ